jgi:hypothetical protein
MKVESEFASHSIQPQRDENPARALVLHRAHEPFHDRDAPVLADGTEARSDTLASAPLLERFAPELTTLVADDVLGRPSNSSNGSVEKPLDFGGSGTLEENRETDHGP